MHRQDIAKLSFRSDDMGPGMREKLGLSRLVASQMGGS